MEGAVATMADPRHDWGPLVGDLAARKARALEMGGEKLVERQHSLGKLTVRERLDLLVDPGTWIEYGLLADHMDAGLGDRTLAADGAASAHDGRGLLADLFREMWRLGKPVIARVRGYALAGGFGLACACDMIVASDDAVFGTPEINVGLWPYMISVPLLRSMPVTGPLRHPLAAPRTQRCFHFLLQNHLNDLPHSLSNRCLQPLAQRTLLAHFHCSASLRHGVFLLCPEPLAEIPGFLLH